jgi:hypothetical protein
VGTVHVEYCVGTPVVGGSKVLNGSGYWLLDVSIRISDTIHSGTNTESRFKLALGAA